MIEAALAPTVKRVLSQISDQDFFEVLARQSFAFFLEYTTRGRYRHAKHTRLIASYCQRIADGEALRLIITAPPRHSKSMTVSESLPAYFLGRNPNKRVILVAYGADLAVHFGRENRRKLMEYGPRVFGVSVSKDEASVTSWGLEGTPGGMVSVGLGGPITGRGADLLIVEDPVKNQQEALSATYRESVWREWVATLSTRLSPSASVVVIMTRWHEDDLVGRLLRSGPEDWRVLTFPCEAEEGDLLGRPLGEPLWPEVGFDDAWITRKKREVGSTVWAALYQQRPSPVEGGVFKRWWWRFWQYKGQEFPPVAVRGPNGELISAKVAPLPEVFDQTTQSWDMAFKDTQDSAFVAGQAWGRSGANYYLLDQVRDRWDFVATLKAFKSFTQRWPQVVLKLVEDKANGPAVISVLQREISGIIAVQPKGSKEARAHAVSPLVEAGNVFLPHPTIAPWVWDFVEECAAFPNSRYKDQVDAMTQALGKLQGPRYEIY